MEARLMLRVIIADDEPLSLSRLRRLVAKEEGVEIIAEASNGNQLLQLMNQHLPDLVITDIRMPSLTGLEAAIDVCQSWDTPPAFIFCTAYPDYAIKAYDALAVGYIVKPIDQVKLSEAISRVDRVNQTQLNAAKNDSGEQTRIVVQAAGQIESYDFADIDYFQASDKSVFAYIGDRPVALDKSLKDIEEELNSGVIRIHRSTLVNISRIKRIYQSDAGGSMLETLGKHELAVSRRMLSSVKQAFKQATV